jgi:hypothetical protein
MFKIKRKTSAGCDTSDIVMLNAALALVPVEECDICSE